MIDFEKIRVKNLLSFGNNFTEFDFKKGITRFTGINGSGKSSIPLDALNFALFGKPYRKVKMGQLVNSRNKKELIVELFFKQGEDEYKIERGLKPDVFKIYKNDEIVPVSSSKRGYQEILEEDILHFNSNLFDQIVAKSLTKNQSFMTLGKSEKRNVIENILDIGLFTVMLKNIKSKIESNDFSLSTIRKDIDNTKLLIEQETISLENLRKIQKKIEEESKVKVDELKEEMERIKEANGKYSLALEKIEKNKKLKGQLSRKLSEARSTIKEKRETQVSLQSTIKAAAAKIKMFETTCAGCAKIKELLVTENVDQLQRNYIKISSEIAELREEVETLDNKIEKINEILANEKFIVGNLERNQERVEEIENSVNFEVSREIDIDETKLKKHRTSLKKLETQYMEVGNQRKHYMVLKSLYSDDGIKAFVIKKYLPTINKLLNTYLQKFNADIVFNFDQEFNEVVLSRHKEDFSYFSFSEGQKKRIDLAVLFAFINFAMVKNRKSNSNLLVLDEIMSGLDAEGKNRLHEVLNEYKEQQNKCIITIDHSNDIDPDNFDQVYQVSLQKGYSTLEKIEN